MTWSESDLALKRDFDRVERHVSERYRLPVVISDVLDPNTGDFNGSAIHLDHLNHLDVALFVLAHLFGHTAQWATDAAAREIGSRYATTAPPVGQLAHIRRYESDASRLALTVFHDAGVMARDGWLSDWAAADWRYLEHFYRTGARLDFRALLRPGEPLLTPLAIPPFTPARWVSRYAF